MNNLEREFERAWQKEAQAAARENVALFRKLAAPVLSPVEEYISHLEERLNQARAHGDPAEVAALESELKNARKILDLLMLPW